MLSTGRTLPWVLGRGAVPTSRLSGASRFKLADLSTQTMLVTTRAGALRAAGRPNVAATNSSTATNQDVNRGFTMDRILHHEPGEWRTNARYTNWGNSPRSSAALK